MENLYEDGLDPHEALRASTALLRLKLELEHNMVISETSGLSPEVENKWLSNIYDFEKQYKDAKIVKVYDLLEKPAFPKWDSISKGQLQDELKRLRGLMKEKHIELDCCCEYDDTVIYRFITEELFDHETDTVFLAGMTHHFIYEEFHPNHDYDLRRHVTDFIECLLSRQWDEEYDVYKLSKVILFNGKEHSASVISAMIKIFQGAHSFFEIEKIEIESVTIEIEKSRARAEAQLTYVGHPNEGSSRVVNGYCVINFVYDSSEWDISGFEFPGLG